MGGARPVRARHCMLLVGLRRNPFRKGQLSDEAVKKCTFERTSDRPARITCGGPTSGQSSSGYSVKWSR